MFEQKAQAMMASIYTERKIWTGMTHFMKCLDSPKLNALY